MLFEQMACLFEQMALPSSILVGVGGGFDAQNRKILREQIPQQELVGAVTVGNHHQEGGFPMPGVILSGAGGLVRQGLFDFLRVSGKEGVEGEQPCQTNRQNQGGNKQDGFGGQRLFRCFHRDGTSCMDLSYIIHRNRAGSKWRSSNKKQAHKISLCACRKGLGDYRMQYCSM